MTDLAAQPLVGQLLAAAAEGDVAGACAAIAAAADSSGPGDLLHSLAGVQVVVGERWAANEWTIADEHRATAVVDAALAVVERLPRPTTVPMGRVSVVCAESEWHTLPARLAAAWLRLGGWSVDFLGGSLPATVLGEDLARRRPDVVAVSCSVPEQLFGARRTISVATKLGLPALAGGAAFGSTAHRARVLGASGWAVGGGAISDAAAEAARARDDLPVVDPALELRALDVVSHRDRLVTVALKDLRRQYPRLLVDGSVAEERTIEDLRSIVRFAAAALLVDDDGLFTDFIDWLVQILSVRRVPLDSLDAGIVALLEADPPQAAVPVFTAGRDRLPSA